MLDGFISGKGKFAQKQTEELEQLIASAREERSAISAMLTALTTRSAKLVPLGKQLEQVTENATAVTTRLDDIGKRLSALDDRATELEQVDKRILALKESARQAEETTQKAIGPDGELSKHREAVQHLASQALQTQAILDTLKKERSSLDELRLQLRDAEKEVKQALGAASTVKGELDQVRSGVSALQQDFSKVRETSREAREDTTAAMLTIKEVEKKLGPLAELHELSKATEERLTALNALAEHVSRKAKALETQQQAVEHAVVQANRVNEMVWSMDVQIGKLSEGMKQAAKAEETVTRIEKLAAETAGRMEAAMKLNAEVLRETGRLEKDTTTLLGMVRAEVDALNVRKKEFESFDARVHGLQGSVSEAETRMSALAEKDKSFIALTQRVDALTKRFEALLGQADELTQKQLAFETLHERFADVDALARNTSAQMAALGQSRQDLDVLRKEVQDFYRSHAEIVQLRDKLGADRLALEAFGDRMNAMAARAPELEAKMNAILGQMKLIEEGTQKATHLNESVAELDAQISRVTSRVPFVDKLALRLNDLNQLSADVDQRLEGQLARRTELDTLKASCDGLAAQMADAQLKLDGVSALQQRLIPLVAELNTLKTEIDGANDRLGRLEYDEATVTEHEKRYAELVASSRAVATEVAERTRQMQGLSEELTRTTGIKDELLVELDRVQSRHRDTISQIQASEDQLGRAEKMFKLLEQRRAQVAFGEKKLAAVETRLAEIKQVADSLDKDMQSISNREQLINAVKAEVETVHEISARSRADLAHVIEHRSDVASLKSQVDLLLSRIHETDERIVAIDGRRRLVDEVQTKANAIVHLLDDVRINLEMLGEQKAVVDHVAEKAAQLEFMLQEARNTLRTLQTERELAERIEQGIRQLRSLGGEERARTA
jgi:chromosome segregation ATPase